jgi:hypothetical protein
MKEFVDPNAPVIAAPSVESRRSILYHYMVQEYVIPVCSPIKLKYCRGILPALLLDGTNIPASAFGIAQALKSGNFTAPPTYVVHGTIDDKVTVRQSIDAVAALRQNTSAMVDYVELEGTSGHPLLLSNSNKHSAPIVLY